MTEVESYLKDRAEEIPQNEAGKVFTACGLNREYARRTDRYLREVENRCKALWPHAGNVHAHGLDWIISLVGPSEHPLVALNRYALDHRTNCVWYSHSLRIGPCRRSAGTGGFT